MKRFISLILIFILILPLASCDKYAFSLKDMFIFTAVEDGWAVAGISVADRTTAIEFIDIPSEYQGKPVVEISNYGFMSYALLINVTIPDSIKRIGKGAFNGCIALTDVYISENVEFIDEYAFSGCCFIKNFNVSANNKHYKSIDGHLFTIDGQLLQYALGQTNASYTFPEGTTSIGTLSVARSMFLSYINFPNTLERIERQAFADSPFLKSITIPDSVTYMGKEAFLRSGIESVTFGNGLEEIPTFAFIECLQLKEASLGSVKIIGETAFVMCVSLERVEMPDTVISIKDGAFGICSSLSSITLPPSLEYLGPRVFTNCDSLTSMDIPDGIDTLRYGTFNLCTQLSEITLPANLTKIQTLCFSGCVSLKRINFEGTMEQWNAIEKEDAWDLGTGNYTVYCIDGNIEK